MRLLVWESNAIRLEFKEDYDAEYWMDLSALFSAGTSGVYDRRTSYGVDGAQTYNAALSSMRVPLTAKVLIYNVADREHPVDEETDRYRQILCQAFDPRNQGKLTFENALGRYFVEGYPESLPALSSEAEGVLSVSVDILCDIPYWQSDALSMLDIGTSKQLLQAPGEIIEETTAGEILTNKAYIPNETGNNLYPIVRFWPNDSTPVLINRTTGKTLSLNQRVGAGMYVDINTAERMNTVTVYKMDDATGDYSVMDDAQYWMSLDSDTDFELVPGGNDLVLDQYVAGAGPAVTMMWRERKTGV